MKSTLRYFNEYLYYDAVVAFNDGLVSSGEKPLTTTQARAIRTKLDEYLSADGAAIDKSSYLQMTKAMTAAFSEYGEFEMPKETYDAKVAQFSAYTGVAGRTIAARQKYSEPYMPLSPFDPDNAYKDAFMRSGSQLFFANRIDLENNDPSTVVLHREMKDTMRSANMSLMTEADRSGVSRLAPYMSQQEYERALTWVGYMGEEDPSRYMTPEAVERSAELLRMMKEDGIAFNIVPDENVGQLVANIEGTRVNVRIMDSRENEQFVGRVYDDGRTYRYITNKVLPHSKYQTEMYTPRNASECYDLLKYAMGQSIQRWDVPEPVGRVGTVSSKRTVMNNGYPQTRTVVNNSAYHSSQNASYLIGPMPNDSNHGVYVHVDNNSGQSNLFFADSEKSDAFLSDAVSSARRNFEEAINLEDLIEKAETYKTIIDMNRAIAEASGEEYVDDSGHSYDFSGDETIAAIQRGYWEIMTSDDDLNVYHPGADLDAYNARLNSEDDDAESISLDNIPTYSGTPSEKVRQHLRDNIDYMIGSFEPDAEGKRFDPVNVARYMTSSYGQFSNNRNIVNALRKSGISADELTGSNYYNSMVKDQLIRFDGNTAVPMYMSDNPFVRDMYGTILNTIRESGCNIDERNILMDANGIVRYTAERASAQALTNKNKESTFKTVTGEIGQIFVPDDNGMLETKFAGSDNYLCVPGYTASVVTGESVANKSLEERTRLRGYQQIMRENIAHTIRCDLLSNYDSVGTTTSVNGTYRQVYDERHPLDWFEKSAREGMDDELRTAIIQTEARRVKYSKDFRDNSTVSADYLAQLDNSGRIRNDNFYTAYNASGQRNIAILSAEGDGYFDPVMTSSGVEQGVTRYLVEGAKVSSDGFIIPSDDKEDMSPLMKHPVMEYSKFDAWDRRQMAEANLIKAACITNRRKIALCTCAGFNMDDAFVVSKEFAEDYPIIANGVLRPLTKGDKILDTHGNKGVIGLVVDRDMPAEEAKKQGIEDVVAFFKNNPGLDLCGSPASGVSRFNGGTAREMQGGEIETLYGPHGEDLGKAVGSMRMIITHLSVDKKSTHYGADAEAGKGRKAGAQLGMILSAADVPGINTEFYGYNIAPLRNAREVCIALGGDMSETGDFKDTYVAHEGENRKIFGLPELEYATRKTKNGETTVLDVASMKRKFGAIISRQGGFLELPFPLKYPNGDTMSKLTEDEHTTVDYKKLEWQVTRTNKDGTTTTYTAHRHDDANAERSEIKSPATYAMPIVSAHLRSEQDFEDGTTHLHDYTNNYLKIYENAIRYIDARNRGDEKAMADYQRSSQYEYNKIAASLDARFISSKNNMFRGGIMSNTIQNSSTTVWTPDPRLGINEVALGPTYYKGLGFKENDQELIWRDPLLRESGMAYLDVKRDDSLTAMAINPATAPRYEGDFDGDTIGGTRLKTKAARADAEAKFSMEATLLDTGYKRKDGTFDLNLQGGLDLAAAHYKHPELAERREALRLKANEIYTSNMSETDKLEAGKEVVKGLNEYFRDCFKDDIGTAVLRIGDAKDVIKSMSEMVDMGFKGSMGKVKKYASFYGVTFDENKDGSINFDSIRDEGRPLVDKSAAYDAQFCTAVKAHGTGLAGRYQHRGIESLRNYCPRAILEMTRPVTQSLLQLKHEDKQTAYKKYSLLMGTVRDLWRGYKMEPFNRPDGEPSWKKSIGKDGKPVQATRDEWVAQFTDIYTSKHGLDIPINPDYVNQIADTLAMHGENGKVMNMEQSDSGKSVMDKLAYDGSLGALYGAMSSGANLFEGKQNSRYMPALVSENIKALDRGEAAKGIVASDVKGTYKPKVSEKARAAAPIVDKVKRMLKSGSTPGFGDTDEPVTANGLSGGGDAGDDMPF